MPHPDSLMLRCEAEGRASKHAPAAGAGSPGLRPSRLASLAPQDEAMGGLPHGCARLEIGYHARQRRPQAANPEIPMSYRAPVAEMVFTMRHVAGLDRAIAEELHGDLSLDLVETIVEEAGKFANDELAPLNRSGDLEGLAFKDGAVTMPRGFKEVYRAWTEAGWNTLPGPEAYGGQGLPTLLNSACVEMWNSACMSFGLAPLLTMGGVEALAQHGSEA